MSDATRAQNGGLGPVSVVVCNYQGERYLEDCLAAVRALAGDVDEVIVVDNASTDGGIALVEARFPEVKVIALPLNDGPCPARNAGMRAARNRWVLALDNDAVVTPDMLTKLAAAATTAMDVAIVQPRSVFWSEPTRVHYDGGSFHHAGLISLRNFYIPVSEAAGSGVVEVDCAVAVALLVDRDALLAQGGYDETMFILFEDLDLSYRLRATGKRILSVEDAIVLHKGGTPGISFRAGPRYPGSRVFFHSRNRWTFLAKCLRWRTLVVALPAIAAYECAWFVLALAEGGIGAWFRGKWRFAKLVPRIRKERAHFQTRRVRADRELLVAGPLTVTPSVRSSGVRGLVLRALDFWMSSWWRLVRPLAG